VDTRRWSRAEYEQMIAKGLPTTAWELLDGDERRQGHPRHAALIVEVAESSLGIDRGRKATLYARAGIPDYWIVNLVDRTLEIHREPVAAPETAAGWHYAEVRSLGPGETVSPVAAPGARIPVADLLP
jgi:Uma2 family endonuclease